VARIFLVLLVSGSISPSNPRQLRNWV